jgi:polyisoprenoid-binding protein YceI
MEPLRDNDEEDGMASSGHASVSALRGDPALAGSWTLDASRSAVRLRSRHLWGLVPVKGVFGEITGAGTVSPAGEVSGTVRVAAASIDTKMKKRDAHLRSAAFLDSAAYPHITFRAGQITASPEAVIVSGVLTVRDVDRPLSLPAAVSGINTDEVRLDAEFHVNRADFGITWNKLGMASMIAVITVHAVFTRR